ncbi:MAG: 4-hydroxyphenylpyruvate dioxygenase [Pseudomonadales bacterium]|nr:4-hydroxyphenylpyruvate dioxygenase [Pseudomonadales bacterium]
MPLARDISTDQTHNPMATDGFEFVEFTDENPDRLDRLFTALGFSAVAQHRSKKVIRYNQGDINFLLNYDSNGHPAKFYKAHGISACAMAFRVENADKALKYALRKGAEKKTNDKVSSLELVIPAIRGIGDSLLFLVDKYGDDSIYDTDFIAIEYPSQVPSVGLKEIDHLTHNVRFGNMNQWTEFYQRLFNFRQIKYFDIRGEKTGLVSRALSSPCNKIKIPINESNDDDSQINEYLRDYQGEGIQHIALTTDDIYTTIDRLKENGIGFLDVPDSYYDAIEARLPEQGEPIAELKKRHILIDGYFTDSKPQLLLQIFTNTVIGPIFFEIIQRKGDDGFGEGNFQALFDAIERDQVKRGVL